MVDFGRQQSSSEAYKELKVLKFDNIVKFEVRLLPIAILTINCLVSLIIILLN